MSKIRICDFCGKDIKQGDMFVTVSSEFRYCSPYVSSDNDWEGDFHVECYEQTFYPTVNRLKKDNSRK